MPKTGNYPGMDISQIRISEVWRALGGGELQHNRGRAFWRNGDGLTSRSTMLRAPSTTTPTEQAAASWTSSSLSAADPGLRLWNGSRASLALNLGQPAALALERGPETGPKPRPW